jgi:hypothetical protein
MNSETPSKQWPFPSATLPKQLGMFWQESIVCPLETYRTDVTNWYWVMLFSDTKDV